MRVTRRQWLRAVGTAAVVLPGRSRTAAAAGVWPSYAGDARNTGFSAGESLDGLGVRWQHETDGSPLNAPVVSDETVYATTRAGRLLALSADNGETSWSLDLPGAAPVGPAMTGAGVVAGTESGAVVTVSFEGTEEWTRSLDGGVSTPPTVSGETVYLATGETVYALAVADGTTRWSETLESDARAAIGVADGMVYVATASSGLYALNDVSGSVDWRYETSGLALAPPVLTDDRVLFGFGNVRSRVVALDTSGREQWRFDAPAPFPSVSATPSTVYLTNRDAVLAVNPTDGTERWRTALSEQKGAVVSVAGDTVYSAEARRLRALDVETGTTKAKIRLDGLPTGVPALANGRLFVGTDAGTLYAVAGGQTSAFGPGLGVGTGLAALGGYAAWRRVRDRTR